MDELFHGYSLPFEKRPARFGMDIKAKRIEPNTFSIEFGYLAAPLAGDGGRWNVTFDEANAVTAIEKVGFWMS